MTDSESDQTENKLDTILRELVSFKKHTTKELEENKKLNKQLLNEFGSIKKELKTLKTEVENQNQKLELQEKKINFLEKQLLETTISIPNIPEVQDEILTDIIYTIAKKLDIKLTTSSISNIYRKRKKNKEAPGDIIVKLNTKLLSDNFTSQVKKKNLKISDIGFKEDQKKLYINHELTVQDKALFFEARKRQKLYNWKYVWEKSGNIFIRKLEGGKVEKIISVDQLKSDN